MKLGPSPILTSVSSVCAPTRLITQRAQKPPFNVPSATDHFMLRFGNGDAPPAPTIPAHEKENQKSVKYILGMLDCDEDLYDVVRVNLDTQHKPYEDKTIVRHAFLLNTALTYGREPETVWDAFRAMNALGFSKTVQDAMSRIYFPETPDDSTKESLLSLKNQLLSEKTDLRIFLAIALPLLKKNLATGNSDQKKNAYELAQCIALNPYNPELAFDMKQTIRPLEAEFINKGVLPWDYWRLPSIGKSGTSEAVKLANEIWNTIPESHTKSDLLRAFEALAVAKAPGVKAALLSKESAFREACGQINARLQEQLAGDAADYTKDFARNQLLELGFLMAGLSGTSLKDLPALPQPESVHPYKWPFSVEYLRYGQLLPALQTMAARGIPGAEPFSWILENGRDEYLKQELPKLFNKDLHPVPFAYGTGSHYSNPQVQKIKLMLGLARSAGPTLIPVLDKLMSRPEAREKVWILELANTINEIRIAHQVPKLSSQAKTKPAETDATPLLATPSYVGFSGSLTTLIP